MRGCIANGKSRSGFFSAEEKKVPASSFTTYRSENRTLPSVIWTEFQGENRPIWCFHLLFHPSFHLAVTAKFPQNSRLASVSAVPGNGR